MYCIKANSLLRVSVDQGVVGEHEAPMWTQQQSVAHIRNGGRFSRPPAQRTDRRNRQSEPTPSGGGAYPNAPDELFPLVHKKQRNDVEHVSTLRRWGGVTVTITVHSFPHNVTL